MPEEQSLMQVSSSSLPGELTSAPLITSLTERLSGDRKPDRQGSSTPANAAQKMTGSDRPRAGSAPVVCAANRMIHPSWLALIELCRDLGHGEIERLSIQDGLPVLAETVKKKIRFAR